MNYDFFKKTKKLTAALIIFAIFLTSFSPLFARKAEAQWVDIVQAAKEMGLDTIAWLVINKIIERMAASTINWINSGFKGSPAYVTDPGAYFTDIADKMAGQFIFSNPNLNFLCGPIRAKIRIALTNNYLYDNNMYRCTLTDVIDNVDDFMNDFSRGGWNGFFELTQRTQNTPLGAYMQAENEMSLRISTRQGTSEKELNWGKGIMSWKTCTKYSKDAVWDNGDGTKEPVCEKEETQTPGTAIENQLNSALGSGKGRLEVADEINEIISALLNQLVSQVVGGIGRGLRGLSSPSSSDSNQTFTNQLSNSSLTSTTDYFGNTVDSTTLSTSPTDYKNSTMPDVCKPSSSTYDPTNPICSYWPPQTATSTTFTRPLDFDCNSMNDSVLTSMAQTLKDNFESNPGMISPISPFPFSSLGMHAGEDLSEIIRNMDCPPAGVR